MTEAEWPQAGGHALEARKPMRWLVLNIARQVSSLAVLHRPSASRHLASWERFAVVAELSPVGRPLRLNFLSFLGWFRRMKRCGRWEWNG